VHSARRDADLFGNCVRNRAADGGAGGGAGVCDESGGGGDSLPSGDRGERETDGISLGRRAEAKAAGTGEAVMEGYTPLLPSFAGISVTVSFYEGNRSKFGTVS